MNRDKSTSAGGQSRIPNPESRVFTWQVRVYWEDTDAGGVVYHARYLHFLERARSEWLRAAGIGQTSLREERGIVFVVHHMELQFNQPARLDDLLDVTVVPVDMRGASFFVNQQVRRAGRAKPLVEARVRIACVDAASFRPRPIPPDLLREMTTT